MFIYKITVIPLNKIYVGLDTGPSYKLSRWSTHQQESKGKCKTKLHKAMKEYGIENCSIDILEDNFETIGNLALAEIEYIKKFDSYKNGLNSTPGGDGLNIKDLTTITDEELTKIKQALSDNFSNYNKNVKWANTSPDDRKELTKHLHTEDVYKKKSQTLKKFYEINPDVKKNKGTKIKQWQMANQELLKENNRVNGAKGAEKVSKKLVVEKEDGTMLYFNSKSEFGRSTSQWANTVLRKTKEGKFHNGYKAWEV